MKKISILFVAMCINALSYSQTYEWVQQIGSNSATNESGFLTISDKNGHVYVITDFMDTIDADPGPAVLEMIANGVVASDKCIQKLNLDGSLVWAKQFGGSLAENLNSFDIDANGDLYMTGTFAGTVDFDMGPGTNLQTADNPKSAFITKFDNNGDLIWVKTMRAKGNVYYGSLEFDASNNLYHSFIFSDSLDVDPNPFIFNYEYSTPNYRSIIMKLDNNGIYQWHKMLDSAYVYYHDIALRDNSIYFVGEIGENTVDVDPGPGITLLTPINNDWDAIYGQLDMNGNLQWVKQAGSTAGDFMEKIAVDVDGNLIIVGQYGANFDFNYGGTPFTISNLASDDAFVYKCTNQGDPIWANPISGNNQQQASSIALDNYGNIYVAGMYDSSVDLDPGSGTFTITSLGGYDGYIAKYHNSGSFIYGWSVGSNFGIDRILSVTTDEENNFYATGWFGNTMSFNTGSGSVNLTSTGGIDGFTVKLSCAPIETSVNVSGNEFSAVETGAVAYQWYNCNTELAIPGETSSTYIADSILHVNVTIFMDNNGCAAVSNCINILGIDNLETSVLSIYPNPSTNMLNIDIATGIQSVKIYNMNGSVMDQYDFSSCSTIKLTPQLKAGVYYIKVIDSDGNLHITKWIKQ